MDASEGDDNHTRSLATELIQKVRSSGRTLLTEHESKLLLSYYGIPTIETRIATDADQAITAAREIGFPVVLKLNSETITHKTDVGGVKLNLQDEDEVRAAFKAIQNSVRKGDFDACYDLMDIYNGGNILHKFCDAAGIVYMKFDQPGQNLASNRLYQAFPQEHPKRK